MSSTNSAIKGRAFGDRVLLGLVILLAGVMVAPALYVIALSLKDNKELMVDPHSVFHLPYTLKNYIDTIGTSSVFRWVMNSVIVAGGLTLCTLVLSSLAGYGFARLNFPGRDALFVIVLLGLAVPEQAVLVARHQIFCTIPIRASFSRACRLRSASS
jgi:multiple sugar transport system permease protein